MIDMFSTPHEAVKHPENPCDWQTSGHKTPSWISRQSLHTGAHMPFEHPPLSSTTAQTFPHSPQLSVSDNGLIQSPPHIISGAMHGETVSEAEESTSVEVVSDDSVVSMPIDVESEPSGTHRSLSHTNMGRHCPWLHPQPISPRLQPMSVATLPVSPLLPPHWMSNPTSKIPVAPRRM